MNKLAYITLMVVLVFALAGVAAAVDKAEIQDLKTKADDLLDRIQKLRSATSPEDLKDPDKEESDGLGILGWTGILVPLLGIGILVGLYFYKRKKGLGGLTPDEIKRRLDLILKVAEEKLRHIVSWMDMKAGGNLPPDEANIWGDAANTDDIGMFEIRESKIDSKIKDQVEKALRSKKPDGSYRFRHGITDDERDMLINSLHGLIFNLILAERLLDKWYGKIMLNKKKMIEKMDDRNADILLSPFIHEEKVMFIFNSTLQTSNQGDAVDVKVNYKHTEAHININETKDMLPKDMNKTVWVFQTPDHLVPGKYEYSFKVTRTQPNGTDKKFTERDMQNPKQKSKNVSEFEITGNIPAVQQNPSANPPAPNVHNATTVTP